MNEWLIFQYRKGGQLERIALRSDRVITFESRRDSVTVTLDNGDHLTLPTDFDTFRDLLRATGGMSAVRGEGSSST